MPRGAHNTIKTHCPHGHPYDEANTYLSSTGRRSCRRCAKDRAAVLRAADIDLVRRKAIEATIRWKRRHPDRVVLTHERQKLRQYGLTIEDYDRMLAAQSGGCAICHEPCKSGRRLAVDHDAGTGAVRGLLCMNCNRAIGMLQHEPRRVEAALAYLRKSVNLT